MSTFEHNPGDIALDAMADRLYRDGQSLGFFHDRHSLEVGTGVCIRSKYGSVRSKSFNAPSMETLREVVSLLKVRVAIKIWCKSIDLIMRRMM